MLPQIPQYHYQRCCRLLDKLPVHHPAMQKFLTATVVEDCPLSEPKHLRQADYLRQRALKWAAKRLQNGQLTMQQAVTEARQMHWELIRSDARYRTLYYLNQLRTIPRDNKPLPLP